MAREMFFNAFRQETLAAAATAARQDSPASLVFHPRTKTVLAFARSFRWLVSPFHKIGN
jgi:hypothetical protein